MAEFLFVVGIGRSGTSLLQNMLNASGQIEFLPENSFLRRFVFSGEFGKRMARQSLDEFAYELVADSAVSRLNVSSQQMSKMLEACGGSGVKLFQLMAENWLTDKPATVFVGDKDPRLIEYVPALAKHFPGSRLIHIYRDPRDVTLSKSRAAWSRHRRIEANLFANAVQWRLIQAYRREHFKGAFIELGYEDLVSDSVRVLNRLCEFLAIDFDPGLCDPAVVGSSLVASDEMPWKKESLGPLLTKNFGKWRSQLSTKDVALIETLNRDILRGGGYADSGAVNNLTLPQRASMAIKSSAIRPLEAIYCWNRRRRQ